MFLKKWSLALIVAALVAPLSASALGISVVSVNTSSGLSYLSDGDTVTFGLLLENGTNEEIAGLGIGVYGYDQGLVGNRTDNALQFVGATSTTAVFADGVFMGSPVNGLDAARPISEQGDPFPFENELNVQLFGGVQVPAPLPAPSGLPNGDGSGDLGEDGVTLTNAGGVHFTVTFAAVAGLLPQDVTLEFGTGQFGNTAEGQFGELAFTNAVQTVTIVPEPGTALLMGLGLAGLAGTRRR